MIATIFFVVTVSIFVGFVWAVHDSGCDLHPRSHPPHPRVVYQAYDFKPTSDLTLEELTQVVCQFVLGNPCLFNVRCGEAPGTVFEGRPEMARHFVLNTMQLDESFQVIE